MRWQRLRKSLSWQMHASPGMWFLPCRSRSVTEVPSRWVRGRTIFLRGRAQVFCKTNWELEGERFFCARSFALNTATLVVETEISFATEDKVSENFALIRTLTGQISRECLEERRELAACQCICHASRSWEGSRIQYATASCGGGQIRDYWAYHQEDFCRCPSFGRRPCLTGLSLWLNVQTDDRGKLWFHFPNYASSDVVN